MATIQMTDMEDDTITFYARQQIWQQYAGTYQRKCLYPWCNRIMNQDNFCVIFYDNATVWDITSIHNMRPVCDVCYASMRLPTMREWVDYMDYSYSVGTPIPLSHEVGTLRFPTPLSHEVGTPTPLSHEVGTPTPLSHEVGTNSHPDGYVPPSYLSFSDPPNDMES